MRFTAQLWRRSSALSGQGLKLPPDTDRCWCLGVGMGRQEACLELSRWPVAVCMSAWGRSDAGRGQGR